jgi:hypothetical protein
MATAFHLMPARRVDLGALALRIARLVALGLLPFVLLIGALLVVGILDWAFALPSAPAGVLAAYLAALLALVLGMYMGGRER